MTQETFENPAEYKEDKGPGKWVGVFFLLMGGIFLLGASGFSILGNSPWILVALLPAYWIGVTAYKRYQEDGHVSRRVFSIAVFGLLPFAYIAASVLDIDVSAIWPLGIIAVGASFLFFGSGK